MSPASCCSTSPAAAIIDEADLAAALRDGRVAGAGIDVFNAEPPTGSPLLDAPQHPADPAPRRVHRGGPGRRRGEVAEQILEVLDGRSARYAVNAPLLTAETAQAIAPYLPLAETLGRFTAQSCAAAPDADPRDRGRAAAFDASSLVAAVLRGLLEHDTLERVNLVNAATLARSRASPSSSARRPTRARSRRC